MTILPRYDSIILILLFFITITISRPLHLAFKIPPEANEYLSSITDPQLRSRIENFYHRVESGAIPTLSVDWSPITNEHSTYLEIAITGFPSPLTLFENSSPSDLLTHLTTLHHNRLFENFRVEFVIQGVCTRRQFEVKHSIRCLDPAHHSSPTLTDLTDLTDFISDPKIDPYCPSGATSIRQLHAMNTTTSPHYAKFDLKFHPSVSDGRSLTVMLDLEAPVGHERGTHNSFIDDLLAFLPLIHSIDPPLTISTEDGLIPTVIVSPSISDQMGLTLSETNEQIVNYREFKFWFNHTFVEINSSQKLYLYSHFTNFNFQLDPDENFGKKDQIEYWQLETDIGFDFYRDGSISNQYQTHTSSIYDFWYKWVDLFSSPRIVSPPPANPPTNPPNNSHARHQTDPVAKPYPRPWFDYACQISFQTDRSAPKPIHIIVDSYIIPVNETTILKPQSPNLNNFNRLPKQDFSAPSGSSGSSAPSAPSGSPTPTWDEDDEDEIDPILRTPFALVLNLTSVTDLVIPIGSRVVVTCNDFVVGAPEADWDSSQFWVAVLDDALNTPQSESSPSVDPALGILYISGIDRSDYIKPYLYLLVLFVVVSTLICIMTLAAKCIHQCCKCCRPKKDPKEMLTHQLPPTYYSIQE